jgi:hypothetical protein
MYFSLNIFSSQHRTSGASEGRDAPSNLLRAAVAAQSSQASPMSRDWAAKLIANSDDVTGSLVWENAADPSLKKQRNQPSDAVCIDDLWIDIKHRIAAAGQCVCTASYIKSTAAGGGPAGAHSSVALDVAHEKLIHSFEFPQFTVETDHVYDDVLESRESAKEDLMDALHLLKTELALSNLAQAAPRGATSID